MSDEVEQLDETIQAEGDGRQFFERTHVTRGMEELISEGMARLAGESTQALFHLKQAMGGGKTHLLIALGLLARNPELRGRYAAVPHASTFGEARIATFNGRTDPENYMWGEIATKLTGGNPPGKLGDGGLKAPGEEDWLRLLNHEEPTLILLDELPPYFHQLNTRPAGKGTVADIATRALSNLITAASKRPNVCVVLSDLTTVYDAGVNLINKALKDAQQEAGRQERIIIPVDLTTNEVYEILRKRLFKSLPDQAEIADIAATYADALGEAAKATSIGRSAEAIAGEIEATYPFHPRLKNLVAMFKDNERFQQTRGLLELMSRLVRSVWERNANDVFLIGAQHFALEIPEVRDKLIGISGLGQAITKDLWDKEQSAHAQVIDINAGNDNAIQVATLLLTASLSTAFDAVKGLAREEMIECLIAPLRPPSQFHTAFEALNDKAWYLHQTPEGRHYFAPQENLTKKLQSVAESVSDTKVEQLMESKLQEMFRPKRKTAYEEVFVLPKLEETQDKIQRKRVLLIVSPDSKIPPEEVNRFFEQTTKKNNILVLTGDRTEIASVETAARQLYAATKVERETPNGNPLKREIEKKKAQYEQMFAASVQSLFDRVCFPIQRPGQPARLGAKPLDMTRDGNEAFDGEAQIEKTITQDPIKLYLDVETNFESLCDIAEDVLWPENQDITKWADALARASEQPSMPWLPPRGIERLKASACERAKWEELDNGNITKKPKRKKTSVQIQAESERGERGQVRLEINPLNAGPAPRVHYAVESAVSESSDVLEDKDNPLTTDALWIGFLAVDPRDPSRTGEPKVWKNTITVHHTVDEKEGQRRVSLKATPRGDIHYTIDGTNPRDGTPYTEPFVISDEEVTLQTFAHTEGLESGIDDVRFAPRGDTSGTGETHTIDPDEPTHVESKEWLRTSSREATFRGLVAAKERGITFQNMKLTVGDGKALVNIGELLVDGDYLTQLLNTILKKFSDDTSVTLAFQKGNFPSGHDLHHFQKEAGIEIAASKVRQ